jgi:hypothetical protein
MSNATPPVGGQTPPAEGQTQGQTPPTSGQTPTTPPQATGDELMSLEAGRRLREENKEFRLAKEAALAKLKQYEDAQLSAQEKATKERDEALAKAQAAIQRAARSDVKVLAQQLGFVHPDDAVALIEGKLQFADDGSVTNGRELLESLKRDRPQYVGQQHPQLPNVSPTNPGGLQGKPFFTGDQIRAMTVDDYVKQRDDLRAAERDGRITK